MDSKTLKIACRSLLIAVGLLGPVAEAVEPTLYELGEGGAIAPHLRFEIGHDNNPLRADEGSQETAFLRLQPSASYLLRRRNNQLSFSYTGDFYQYFENYCLVQTGVVRPGDCLQGSRDFDKASYQDHELALDGFLEVTSRVRASFQLSQSIEHQPLGTGLSITRIHLDELTSPDDWSITRAAAQLSYGASQARGELRAGFAFADRELRSDRDINLDVQSDTSLAPFARLLYRVGTRTQLFAGVRFDQVRDGILFNRAGQALQDLERDITSLSFGAELDDTSVTSGSVSIIAVNEDFLTDVDFSDDGIGGDFNFLAWDINLIWRPRTFSTVTLSGGRRTETGVADSDLSLTTNLGVNWVHFWRDRLSTRFQANIQINEDVLASSTSEEFDDSEDTTIGLKFEGNYNIRRWLDIGGFVEIDSRDGRADVRDFGRTVIGVTANGTI